MRPLSIIVLDSETSKLTGGVYDVGYCIANKKGKIMQERNWLVQETITNSDSMMGAFFAGKTFTRYIPMLDSGTITLKPWLEIIDQMNQDILDFKVNILAAYNLAFDRRVMAQTHIELGHTGKVLRSSLKQLDLWRFVCESKLDCRLYKEIAVQQGWTSEAGNIRTTAEHAYRYLSQDYEFYESHTALDDARIETAIMAFCFAAHKKIPYGIVDGQAWKIVNS